MKTYPEIVTPEVLAANKHISQAEVLKDIADTEREIQDEEKKAEAYGLLAIASFGAEAKMSDFRHSAAISAIADRKAFVEFLRKLHKAREQ